MKKIVIPSVLVLAAAAYGGFWSTLNKVQKTVETVNAVGEAINGTPAQSQQSAQPAAQQPTAVSVAQSRVAQVSAAAADPMALAAFAGSRTTATDTAVPEVKWGNVYVRKPATPEQVLEAKNAYLAEKRDMANATIRFENVDDATVAATLAVFHQAANVDVSKSTLTTLAPFALLRNVQKIGLNKVDCADLKPFAGLANVKTLSLHYCTISDFAPLVGLRSLEYLDLYGASVTGSFAPLAACPKLRKVDYYAVKGPQEVYDSLGALVQVTEFHGGLTKMTSIKWLRTVPQTETLKVFAEKIDDFTPISTLVNLTYFRGWSMDGGSMATALGDLSFLAPCRKLKKLELPGSAYSNMALIGTFTELEELDLSNVKQPVDVSFVKSLPKLKRLSLNGTQVVNGSAIPAGVKVDSDKKTTGL
jgi:hypothetical protein